MLRILLPALVVAPGKLAHFVGKLTKTGYEVFRKLRFQS